MEAIRLILVTELFSSLSSLLNSYCLPTRFNPIRESEDAPSTEDILKLLRSKIINSFSSIKEAFLVFDDVRLQLEHFLIPSLLI